MEMTGFCGRGRLALACTLLPAFMAAFLTGCSKVGSDVDTIAVSSDAETIPPRPVAEPILAVETIEDVLPINDQNQRMRDPLPGEEFPPLRVLLSRERYWQQDGHLDVVVRLELPVGVTPDETRLEMRLLDAAGRELSRAEITAVPSLQFIFYPSLPDGFLGRASLALTWLHGSHTLASDQQAFRVERFEEPAPRSGRIRLSFPNTDRVSLRNMPVTAGVPFGRGILASTDHLRLVDDAGREVYLQVEPRARWSKFGSIKWVLCDFTVDLAGQPRDLYLEYGPDVRRQTRSPIAVTPRAGFPVVEAGRLRMNGGLWFDVHDNARHIPVLAEAALHGAFVQHEDGRVFRMPSETHYDVEEHGSERVTLRRSGWYRDTRSGQEFCQYITRYVIHRDSPIVRLFHTWIFTGDGNRDRISNMGWRFALPEDFRGDGFLTAFGAPGAWQSGDLLLQWDYEHFDVLQGQAAEEHPGGRAPGVARAQGTDAHLYFGTKDFWQNYPSELEFRGGALWFHNWPRHNRPAGYTLEGELITGSGPPALPSAARHQHYQPGRLTRSEWTLNAIQARFAHEGEMLNFRLPEEFGEPTIANAAMRVGRQSSHHWEPGNVETANAQGISRTEEMWLFIAPPETDRDSAARLLEALNEERLRAVVDPVWVAASGAFFEMHHQDRETYPEEERAYELLALSVGQIIERLGVYGMWIYGDVPAWHPQLPRREPSLYRGYRKIHHGWPFTWEVYARSGDSRMLKIAEAANSSTPARRNCARRPMPGPSPATISFCAASRPASSSGRRWSTTGPNRITSPATRSRADNTPATVCIRPITCGRSPRGCGHWNARGGGRNRCIAPSMSVHGSARPTRK